MGNARRTSTLSVALLAATLFGSATARAYYEESHVTADDVRVTVDDEGRAHVEHALTWHVVAGQPRTIDLAGVEASAALDSTAGLESDDGKTVSATVAAVPGKGVRVTVAQPKALRHGHVYHLTVGYTVGLVGEGELTREGPSYRLAWRAPLPSEGYENPKVTFVLPAALEPPSLVVGDDATRDDGVVATLKRAPTHDEMTLTRPHVGRGEELRWVIRVDARAFETGHAPPVAPPPAPPTTTGVPTPKPFAYALLAGLAVAYALAVRKKRAWLTRAGGRDAGTRGLVPLPPWEQAALAGATLFVGLSLELGTVPLAGAVVVAVAMALGVVRPPRPASMPRGPGRWTNLRSRDAFPVRTRRLAPFLVVSASAVLGVAAFVVVGRALAHTAPSAAILLPFDAIVVWPLVAVGRRSQLPDADAARERASLARLFTQLRHDKGLRATVVGRFAPGADHPDLLRLSVMPREPLPGLLAIEVGLAGNAPEILLRVVDETVAAREARRLCEGVVPSQGRAPEERVYPARPALPTQAATVALVSRLARALEERRRTNASWNEDERRVSAPLASVPLPVT